MGLSFRNLDDSFWPSAQSFMPDLMDIYETLRQLTDAPIAIGSRFLNIDYDHALAVCHELINRKLGSRIRWYAYLAVTPFDAALAGAMAKAGCVGINFTGDAGSAGMLR